MAGPCPYKDELESDEGLGGLIPFWLLNLGGLTVDMSTLTDENQNQPLANEILQDDSSG